MLPVPKWRTKKFPRTVAVFWNTYSNMHDSLALDFFKMKKLKEPFEVIPFILHQHPSTLIKVIMQDPTKHQASLIFQRHSNTVNLLSKLCMTSFTHMYVYVHIHTRTTYAEGGHSWKLEAKAAIHQYAEAHPNPVIWLAVHEFPQPLPWTVHPRIRWNLRKVQTVYKHVQKHKKEKGISHL